MKTQVSRFKKNHKLQAKGGLGPLGWRALVVRPRIPQGRGIFAEKSETHIWLSDNPQRIVLAIQSNFSFGQVTLKLKDYVVPGVTQP